MHPQGSAEGGAEVTVCMCNLQGSQPKDRASSVSPRYDAKGLGIPRPFAISPNGAAAWISPNVRQMSVNLAHTQTRSRLSERPRRRLGAADWVVSARRASLGVSTSSEKRLLAEACRRRKSRPWKWCIDRIVLSVAP